MRPKPFITMFMLIALIAGHAGCGSGGLRQEDRWEGIDNNILRVYVSHDFVEYIKEEDEEKVIRNTLLTEAKKRAVNVLVNHIRLKYPELRNTRPVELKIIECFEKGTITYQSCEEEECRALVSFDIEPVLNMLQKKEPANP